MKRKQKNKLLDHTGESIAETLVALLISAVALVMLAAIITSSSNIIKRSRSKLDTYYNGNEYVAKMETVADTDTEGETPTVTNPDDGVISQVSGKVTIALSPAGNTSLTPQEIDVTFYRNASFGKNPVISYKENEQTTHDSGGDG